MPEMWFSRHCIERDKSEHFRMINHYGPHRLGALDPSVPAKTLLKALPAGQSKRAVTREDIGVCWTVGAHWVVADGARWLG
jgi:hypothetical protein